MSIVDLLLSLYGPPAPPIAKSPLEMILWENVAYLADDDKRADAFELLRTSTGLVPERIASSEDETLLAVARHGIVPDQTVAKLRKIAELAMSEFGGDVDSVLAMSTKEAMRSLRKFPAIGEPAAEKILMMNEAFAVLALESNGLRVLQRLGYADDTGNYSHDYKAMRIALAPQTPIDCPWLTTAHLVLRRHGQAVCRRSTPNCAHCPLAPSCAYFSRATG